MIHHRRVVQPMLAAALALIALACTCGAPLSGFFDPDTDAPPTYTYGGNLGEGRFDSYTARYTVTFEGTNLDTNDLARLDLTADLAAQRQPAQASVATTFTVEGIDFLAGDKSGVTTGEETIVWLDGMLYRQGSLSSHSTGSSCDSWSQPGGIFEINDLMSYSDFGDIVADTLEGVRGALPRVEPNEWVNGLEARHYRIEGIELDDLDMSDVTIEVWVARRGGYVVRVQVIGQSTKESGLVGPITITYDLLSTNFPVDVSIPAGCTDGR